MPPITLDSLSIGDTLPPLAVKPISRTTLALYAGASGDHNPIHLDIDFAKRFGLDDVIAHGMLIMAYAGRMLTDWVPQSALVSAASRIARGSRVCICSSQLIALSNAEMDENPSSSGARSACK